MAKYSFEIKRQILEDYLTGKGACGFLAESYGIPGKETFRKWVKQFEAFGDEGLKLSRKKITYSFEFKLRIVELYLSSDVSYHELAIQEGMKYSSIIARWVNDFRIVGPDALKPKDKERKKTLESSKKKRKRASAEGETVETRAEHLKELENENLKLRIENAYLKELRRLRLEEETLLKKQRG